MKNIVKALGVSLSIAASSALADASGFYLGAGAGQAKYRDWIEKSDLMEGLDFIGDELAATGLGFDGVARVSSDDKDVGFKIFGGYKFGKNFALEASYLDLGEASAKVGASGTLSDGFFSADGSTEMKGKATAEALTLDAVLTLPVADIAVIFFKAGAYLAEVDAKVSGNLTIEGVELFNETEKFDERSSGAHFGLGVDFNITQQIALRAEWERLSRVEFEDEKSDIDLLSASILYRF